MLYNGRYSDAISIMQIQFVNSWCYRFSNVKMIVENIYKSNWFYEKRVIIS